MKKCPICEFENPDNMKFCGNCGASLVNEPATAEDANNEPLASQSSSEANAQTAVSKKSKAKFIGVFIAVVIILSVLIIIVFLLHKPENTQRADVVSSETTSTKPDDNDIVELSAGDIIKYGETLNGKTVRVSGYVNQLGVPEYNEKYGYVTYYLKFSENEQVQVNYSGPDAQTIEYPVLDIIKAEGVVTKVYKVKDTILQIDCKKMSKIGEATPPPGSPLLDNESSNTTNTKNSQPKSNEPKEFIRENYGYVDYKELARNPDAYKGKSLTYSGKVIQVIEDGDEVQHRIAVNGDYDSIILVGYPKSIVTSRILEDDYVTIYGTSIGVVTYQSTLSGNITIPGIYLDRIELQQ